MNENKYIVKFPEGLPGIEAGHDFQLFLPDPEGPFFELKSLKNEAITLVLTDPRPFFPHYRVELPIAELESIGITDEKAARILVVTVLSDDVARITVNLLAPVVINIEKGLGKQVLLNNAEYGVRHPLFSGTAFR
ncbi:flagellar assembly protein FliW [Effusibacillus dendaii]|uniref:Flagellar assembly factor FliW n=1 Tax=Effusibacillus dendaii TaxID=2743772 RepID=A0A7I8DCW4_9BACL|nr:flagellar assembly protein FliW [Effusibacillus dendaii]BCJ87867.1 flagellar assembly factor FliW [Effusibacillus dendaii]